MGFASGTYEGYVALTSLDGEGIEVKAKQQKNGFLGGAGTVADVQSFGLNEQTLDRLTLGAQVTADKLTTSDDPGSTGSGGPTDSASAAAKAATINAVTDQTGDQCHGRERAEAGAGYDQPATGGTVTGHLVQRDCGQHLCRRCHRELDTLARWLYVRH